MTQGTYKRCSVYRCKKKAMPGRKVCPLHHARHVEQMMESNKSMTELVEAVVDSKLFEYGLIGK